MVGAGRFELPTPCSRSKCATRLRYAPPDRQPDGTAPKHGIKRIVLGEGGFIALKECAGKRRPGWAAVGSLGEYLNFQSGILGHPLAGIAHLRPTD